MTETTTDAVEQNEVVITEPSRFKVVIYNDDLTPMEFVISLLMKIFKHNEEISLALTMQIHDEGKTVAGIFSFEIAEQKGMESTNISRQSGFPLIIKVEAE